MINIKISSNPWRLPGPPTYFEGAPSPAEAQREREEAAAARAVWQPGPKAHALLAELRSVVGQIVVVQGWDPIMWYMDDEGPAPIRARLRDVITRNDDGHERAFLVLDGSRPDESQLFDVADLYELTVVGDATEVG